MKSPIWRTRPELDHQNDVFSLMQKAVVCLSALALVFILASHPYLSELPLHHPKTLAVIVLALNVFITVRRLTRAKSQRLP